MICLILIACRGDTSKRVEQFGRRPGVSTPDLLNAAVPADDRRRQRVLDERTAALDMD